jgi:hypothetical protein
MGNIGRMHNWWLAFLATAHSASMGHPFYWLVRRMWLKCTLAQHSHAARLGRIKSYAKMTRDGLCAIFPKYSNVANFLQKI